LFKYVPKPYVYGILLCVCVCVCVLSSGCKTCLDEILLLGCTSPVEVAGPVLWLPFVSETQASPWLLLSASSHNYSGISSEYYRIYLSPLLPPSTSNFIPLCEKSQYLGFSVCYCVHYYEQKWMTAIPVTEILFSGQVFRSSATWWGSLCFGSYTREKPKTTLCTS